MIRYILPTSGDFKHLRVEENLDGKRFQRDTCVSALDEVKHGPEIIELSFLKLEMELRKDIDYAAKVQIPAPEDS